MPKLSKYDVSRKLGDLILNFSAHRARQHLRQKLGNPYMIYLQATFCIEVPRSPEKFLCKYFAHIKIIQSSKFIQFIRFITLDLKNGNKIKTKTANLFILFLHSRSLMLCWLIHIVLYINHQKNNLSPSINCIYNIFC